MKAPHLSTKAKRKALAARVAALASEVLGVVVAFEEGQTLDPAELRWHSEHETERGPACVTLTIDRTGLDVHSRFDFVAHAPSGANPYSGKWNHYPDSSDWPTLERRLRVVLAELRRVDLPERTGPSMDDLWAHYREEWRASRAAAQ